MSVARRSIVAAVMVIASLPALVACVVAPVLTFAMARLGGYGGTVADAIMRTLIAATRSFSILAAVLMVVCAVVYWVLFALLLSDYVRARRSRRWIQMFCLAVVLFAIGERLRLEISQEDTYFWFGVLSVPHAIALFTLFAIQPRPARPACA